MVKPTRGCDFARVRVGRGCDLCQVDVGKAQSAHQEAWQAYHSDYDEGNFEELHAQRGREPARPTTSPYKGMKTLVHTRPARRPAHRPPDDFLSDDGKRMRRSRSAHALNARGDILEDVGGMTQLPPRPSCECTLCVLNGGMVARELPRTPSRLHSPV